MLYAILIVVFNKNLLILSFSIPLVEFWASLKLVHLSKQKIFTAVFQGLAFTSYCLLFASQQKVFVIVSGSAVLIAVTF
jgi:hypothetical protein